MFRFAVTTAARTMPATAVRSVQAPAVRMTYARAMSLYYAESHEFIKVSSSPRTTMRIDTGATISLGATNS